MYQNDKSTCPNLSTKNSNLCVQHRTEILQQIDKKRMNFNKECNGYLAELSNTLNVRFEPLKHNTMTLDEWKSSNITPKFDIEEKNKKFKKKYKN